MKRLKRYRRTYQAFHSNFASVRGISVSLSALCLSKKSHTESRNKPTDLRGLMIAAQEGDSDAYRHLLSQVVNLLAQFYLTRLPAPLFGSAIRSALLTIHAVRHTYDPATPFEPWLYEIATFPYRDAHSRTPRPAQTSPWITSSQNNSNKYQ